MPRQEICVYGSERHFIEEALNNSTPKVLLKPRRTDRTFLFSSCSSGFSNPEVLSRDFLIPVTFLTREHRCPEQYYIVSPQLKSILKQVIKRRSLCLFRQRLLLD